jgi:hypothetical protein
LRPLTTFLHQDFILAGKFTLRFSEHMIPETKRTRIIEALKARPNSGAVAREHGVGKTTVIRMAKQANIKLAGKRQVSAEQRAQIIAALRVNPDRVAVGAATGWSNSTIWIIARQAEIPLKMGERFKAVPVEPKAESAATTRELARAAATAHAAHKAKGASAAKRLARLKPVEARDHGAPASCGNRSSA